MGLTLPRATKLILTAQPFPGPGCLIMWVFLALCSPACHREHCTEGAQCFIHFLGTFSERSGNCQCPPTPPRLIFEGERITQDNETVLLFISLQLLDEGRSTYHTCPVQVHNSAIFSDFTEGCDHHHSSFQMFSSPQEDPSVHLQSTSSYLWPQNTTHPLSDSINLPFLHISSKLNCILCGLLYMASFTCHNVLKVSPS